MLKIVLYWVRVLGSEKSTWVGLGLGGGVMFCTGMTEIRAASFGGLEVIYG